MNSGMQNHALIKYTNDGNVRMVEYKLSSGANVHANNDRALYLASKNGDLNMVRLLLNFGANVEAGNNKALRAAKKAANFDVIHELELAHDAIKIDNGIDLDCIKT